MEKEIKTGGKTVKKETMWLVAFITLVVGFLGGVVFGVYKTGSDKPFQKSMVSQPVEKDQGASVERAAQIFQLEKKTKENPDDAAAWASLGNLYFDNGNLQKAITAYTTSLALKPNDANVITDLGIMYRRSGQPNKAIEEFDKAAEIDPKHETALFNKGIVLMHDLNDFDGAIQAWQELLKRNPAATSPSGQPIKDLIEKIKESKRQLG
jgi:cytochrome c-type biogenesis protein CcmH/NrfG